MRSADLVHTDDDDLLAAVVRGDRSAFAALFRRHRAEVYRFAMYMTGSRSAADDITQDVFLALIHDAGRYEPGRGTVSAWLCGIARNYSRRRAARERALTPLADEQPREGVRSTHVTNDDPFAEVARLERVDAVRQAVLRLPVKYREVIVLCDLEEMTYAEAAAVLGCAVGTVRSRLHRGRTLLAAKLAALEDPSGWRSQRAGCFA